MAMTFGSESIEFVTDLAAETVSIAMVEDLGMDQATLVMLTLTEDQAVEVATHILMQVTKLRAERLPQD